MTSPSKPLGFASRLSDAELERMRPGPMDPPCEPGDCALCDERSRREELGRELAREKLDPAADYGGLPF